MSLKIASGLRSACRVLFGFLAIGVMSVARLSAQTPTINLSFAPEGIGIGSCGELVIEIENPSAAVVDQLAFR
ncbi:MAG: hypothetical protein ACPGAP_11450, partial [Akkermansiaceae bacterium]